MDNHSLSPGFAFYCDISGNILEVINNTIKLDRLSTGVRLADLFGSFNYYKVNKFLEQVRSSGSAYNWDFDLKKTNPKGVVQVSGAVVQKKIMIMGMAMNEETLTLIGEMVSISNEQTNALKFALKEANDAAQEAKIDTQIIEEFSRLNNELISTKRELMKKNKELERLYEEVQALSLIDKLTGLLNRRGFEQKAGQEWEHALRYKRPLSMIMFDIDRFKNVNDSYGHAIGDYVLKSVAQRCESQLRKVDIFSRHGGEEFCTLLPETKLEQAGDIAEKLRLITLQPLDTEVGQLNVSISLGVAEHIKNVTNLEELQKNADQALYKAKQSGRNCTILY